MRAYGRFRLSWRGLACAGLTVLAACGSSPQAPPEAATPGRTPPSAVREGSAAPPPLAAQGPTEVPGLGTEQRWLAAWFRGTPVVIAQNDDGEVVVEVPGSFCFDPGASRIRPPLAAVLDKVAQSLRRRPSARLVTLAAPADGRAGTPLALQRAQQMHKRLLERGVLPGQLSAPSTAMAAVVQLRIGLAGGP